MNVGKLANGFAQYSRWTLTLFLLFLSTNSLQAAEPGVIAGEFSVDASGSANYQIPIAVPPGTSGMQPSLTLSYNSRSGNGLLGVGWALGGLSVITRCPANTAVDGFIDGIDFDANDRFCIDGQRLIQVTGTTGQYGDDGIEYRIEVDGFTQVTSYDTDASNNGPEYFIAKTKSGQILEYGNTADSRIEAEGKTDARLWAVNKISDTVGNYLTVTYNEDVTNGSYKLTQIDYTGNANASPALTPDTQVQFEYETRTDISTLYFVGSKVKNTERLTNIKTYSDSTLVRDYQLTYDNNGAANRSRLTSITECDGQTSPSCFKPIEFEWQDETNLSFSTNSVTGIESYGGYSGGNGTTTGYSKHLFDMNGDGIIDYVLSYNPDKYIQVYLGNGDATFSSQYITAIEIYGGYIKGNGLTTGYQRHFEDMNGDGLVDYVLLHNGTRYVDVHLNQGDTTFSNTPITLQLPGGYSGGNGTTTGYSKHLYDMNGDGILDYVLSYNPDRFEQVHLGQGDGSFATNSIKTIQNYGGYTKGNGLTTGYQRHFEDMNGDGLVDYVLLHNGTRYVLVHLNQGDTTFSNTPITFQLPGGYSGGNGTTTGYSKHLYDMNGDGILDYVLSYNPDRFEQVHLGQGDGSFATNSIKTIQNYGGYTKGNGLTTGYQRHFEDMNGDGLVDYVLLHNGTRYVLVHLNQGDTTFSNTPITFQLPGGYSGGNGTTTGYSKHLYDMNGDGMLDYVLLYNPDRYVINYLGQDLHSHIITKITNGLGTTTDITYTPITDSTVYTKGSNAVYPEVDIQGPVYVVSKVTADDGIGGTRDTDYTYTEAKSSIDGRGFLGFKTMSAMDSNTGINTTTTYSQTHPYIGLVERTEQRQSNNALLGEVDTTFANKQTHIGIETDTSHPGVLFPYAATVTKKDYEID